MQNSMELADAFADVENHTQGAKNSMSNYLIGCMDDQDFVSLTKEGAEDDHNFVGYIGNNYLNICIKDVMKFIIMNNPGFSGGFSHFFARET